MGFICVHFRLNHILTAVNFIVAQTSANGPPSFLAHQRSFASGRGHAIREESEGDTHQISELLLSLFDGLEHHLGLAKSLLILA